MEHHDSVEDVRIPYQLFRPETPDLTRALLQRPEISEHLAFLKGHHVDSYEHCLRVGVLSIDLALELGLGPDEVLIVGAAGLLHDLGKCDVAEDLLSKAAGLSPEERTAMQAHTRSGFDRLQEPVFTDIRRIVVAHHEFKLAPYPRSLTDRRSDERGTDERRADDERIRSYTATVAVTDMLDALASRRSYKEPLPPDEVERVLRAQFTGDPTLIDRMLRRQGA